ncbi:MAG: hypothetical protein QXO27_03520 [Candidatus Aenigmatarchaeota archaeon]
MNKHEIIGFIEKIKEFIPNEYDLDIAILYSFDSKLTSRISLYNKKRNILQKILENIPFIDIGLNSYAMEIYVPDDYNPKNITQIRVKPKYKELADNFVERIRESYGTCVSPELVYLFGFRGKKI